MAPDKQDKQGIYRARACRDTTTGVTRLVLDGNSGPNSANEVQYSSLTIFGGQPAQADCFPHVVDGDYTIIFYVNTVPAPGTSYDVEFVFDGGRHTYPGKWPDQVPDCDEEPDCPDS